MEQIGLFDAIYTARALRRLKPDPVPDEIIERVIDAAIRAPSGSNAQDWFFIAVKDPQKRARLGDIYRRASKLLGVLYKYRPVSTSISKETREKMMDAANHLFQHLADVPVIIIAGLNRAPYTIPSEATTPELTNALKNMDHVGGASIYPAVQNIILACRAFGLGTVLTTIHAYFEDEVKALLELPPDAKTYALLPVGYPEEGYGHSRILRQPISKVAYWDSWGRAMRVPPKNV